MKTFLILTCLLEAAALVSKLEWGFDDDDDEESLSGNLKFPSAEELEQQEMARKKLVEEPLRRYERAQAGLPPEPPKPGTFYFDDEPDAETPEMHFGLTPTEDPKEVAEAFPKLDSVPKANPGFNPPSEAAWKDAFGKFGLTPKDGFTPNQDMPNGIPAVEFDPDKGGEATAAAMSSMPASRPDNSRVVSSTMAGGLDMPPPSAETIKSWGSGTQDSYVSDIFQKAKNSGNPTKQAVANIGEGLLRASGVIIDKMARDR